jgi:uncharacterized surface protein with fasciclin (FAS1) repeats
MKKTIIAFGVALLASASLAATAGAAPKANGTIVDVAAKNKSFSTLVSLVQAAGLAGALSAENVQLTVFAPTNAAFKNLEAAVPGVTAALTKPANKKLLVAVLRHHVLGSKVVAADAIAAAKTKAKVATLLGNTANGKIGLSLAGGKLTVSDSAGLNKAIVTKANLMTSNGVIHVVDKVLVPKSVAAALTKAGLVA